MDEASAFVRIWNRRMYVCGKRLQKGSMYVRMWNLRMYVCGKRLQKGSMYVCGNSVCTYAESICRKEVHTESVVALSNSEGQTAGGTRERAGRVGVTKKAAGVGGGGRHTDSNNPMHAFC